MFKPKYFLDKIVFRFTHFPFIYHKENISDMYNHVIRVYCIIVSCMIVLLVRGVRGDCSGPSDGNCARISEEREDWTLLRPVSASSGAGARLLPSAARDPHTGHDHSYEHRGPGQAEVPRPGVNSSVLQVLAAKAAQ